MIRVIDIFGEQNEGNLFSEVTVKKVLFDASHIRTFFIHYCPMLFDFIITEPLTSTIPFSEQNIIW